MPMSEELAQARPTWAIPPKYPLLLRGILKVAMRNGCATFAELRATPETGYSRWTVLDACRDLVRRGFLCERWYGDRLGYEVADELRAMQYMDHLKDVAGEFERSKDEVLLSSGG